MEKPNTIHNITKLLQLIEMFIFSVLVSSQLPLAVNVSTCYLRAITFTSFTPKFVFAITNVIILALFVISKVDENHDGNDTCYEYVKSYDMSVYDNNMDVVASNKRKISRSKSEDPVKTKCRDGRALRRSRTELSRSNKAEKLSGEEFRRTVEAFIARQQRMLRDEEFSPMVYIGS